MKFKFDKFLESLLFKTKKIFFLNNCIAHHGLQRNGTNFLLKSLEKNRLRIINGNSHEYFDKIKFTPGHKHFRWYKKKELIPKQIGKFYKNNINVTDIFQLNKVSCFPMNTKHIVIYKKIDRSVLSMINWFLRRGVCDKHQAINAIPALKIDYQNYLNFWKNMTIKNEKMVSLIKK